MSGPRARRVSVVAGLASQRILETAQTLLAGPGRGAEAKLVPEGAARVERVSSHRSFSGPIYKEYGGSAQAHLVGYIPHMRQP